MKKIVFGIIIMIVGVLLLFDNLNFFSYNIQHWLISWQALLIAIGAVMLADKKRDNKQGGVILIFIGSIFLVPKIFEINISSILVPALIICAGIFFIITAVTKKNRPMSFWNHHTNPWGRHKKCGNFDEMPYSENCSIENGNIRKDYVFSESKERWTCEGIKNIEIGVVFSGVELDLSQAELDPETQQVNISIHSVFSGVTLYVPSEWNILIQRTGAFSGFEDKRSWHVIKQATESKVKVILTVDSVFSGGEIKCYE